MRAETVTITCPCCEHEIEVTVLPSEPRTHDHPGAAADYEDPRGCSCSCYLSGRLADQYDREVWERALEAAADVEEWREGEADHWREPERDAARVGR